MMTRRARCTGCDYIQRLRKDGTMQAHKGLEPYMRARTQCPGTGKLPVPYDPNTCGACMEFWYGTPMLIEAIYSVAIESPKSGEQLTWEFLEAYHENKHQEMT